MRVAVACVCVWSVALAAATTYHVPTVSFSDLSSKGEQVARALKGEGLIALTNIPSFEVGRIEALTSLSSCKDGAIITMHDGSRRHTIGARVESGERKEVESKCGGSVERLRQAVDTGLAAAMRAASPYFMNLKVPLMDREDVTLPPLLSLLDLVRGGEGLEHFHTYDLQGSEPEDVTTMEMHTDEGLLIAMTAGLYMDTIDHAITSSPSREDGLYIRTRHGDIARAIFPDDSLLIMMGQGAESWLEGGGRGLRAVPHLLRAGKSVSRERHWYGRMVFPPFDAIVDSDANLSYYDYKRVHLNSVVNNRVASSTIPVACPLGTSVIAPVSCTTGTGEDGIYCWTQCVALPTCNSTSIAFCVDTFNDTEVDGTVMCPHHSTCQPECRLVDDQSPSDDSSSGKFCVGQGTTMYMDGFRSTIFGGSNTLCVNLFFLQWTLDTPVKFAFGCLGAFLLAIVVEGIFIVRKRVHEKVKHRRALKRCFEFVFHFFGAILGYIAMLVAMTYNIELGLSLCLGLATGYVIFQGDSDSPPSTAEPCCRRDDADYKQINDVETSRGIGLYPATDSSAPLLR